MSNNNILHRLAEIQAAQDEIIMIQREVIDDLFRLLMQHVDESELQAQMEKLNRAAELKAEIDF